MADNSTPLVGFHGEANRPDWLPRSWRSRNWPMSLTLESVDHWLRLTDESLVSLGEWERDTLTGEEREQLTREESAGTDVVSDVSELVTMLRADGYSIPVELPVGKKFTQLEARQLIRNIRDALRAPTPGRRWPQL